MLSKTLRKWLKRGNRETLSSTSKCPKSFTNQTQTYQIRFYSYRTGEKLHWLLSRLLQDNLIHCAVYCVETDTFYNITGRNRVLKPDYPWDCEVTIQSSRIPVISEYSVGRTLLEFFNPLQKEYSKHTANCCTLVADLCQVPRFKRPVDIYEAISYLA